MIKRYYSKNQYKYHSLEKFTGINKLTDMFLACNIRPSIKKNGFQYHWRDDYNNTIEVVKKKLKVTYNDINISADPKDQYLHLPIEKVSRISEIVYFLELNNTYIISFLGIDNILRTFIKENTWERIPSLMLGLDAIKDIIEYNDIISFIKLEPHNGYFPFENGKAWISCNPIPDDLIQDLNVNLLDWRK
jgi:hypothetical protein